MRAVARYDFGMGDAEFRRATLPEFWALWERRAVEFKRQQYLQGIVASAVYNVNRTEASQHLFDALDFIPRSEADAQRDEILMLLKREYTYLAPGEISGARAALGERLKAMGRTDVEELLADVFND